MLAERQSGCNPDLSSGFVSVMNSEVRCCFDGKNIVIKVKLVPAKHVAFSKCDSVSERE